MCLVEVNIDNRFEIIIVYSAEACILRENNH